MTTSPLLLALVHPLISHTGRAHCGPSTAPQWKLSLTLLAPLKAVFSTFLKLLPKESPCCTGDVWASLSYPGSGSPFLFPQPCSLRSGDGASLPYQHLQLSGFLAPATSHPSRAYLYSWASSLACLSANLVILSLCSVSQHAHPQASPLSHPDWVSLVTACPLPHSCPLLSALEHHSSHTELGSPMRLGAWPLPGRLRNCPLPGKWMAGAFPATLEV